MPSLLFILEFEKYLCFPDRTLKYWIIFLIFKNFIIELIITDVN